ncbi:MAG: DUF1679 domain-containing protein [Pseudomonadota bacterium]
MNNYFKDIICKTTGATELFEIKVIQSLWSGYGKIVRYGLIGCSRKTVVVKHVQLPNQKSHPRGWNTDISHQRKIKSYQIEIAWYRLWSKYCDIKCRVPYCLAFESVEDEVLIVLEDLDQSGYPKQKNTVSMAELKICLSWLANFHATFMTKNPDELWPIGTYWHLDTRPDELQALNDIKLKNAAYAIDQQLQNCTYQSFVHGDAKLANFCFSTDGKKVAAVDFQYVGGGCGMKDIAYFIGSCLYEEDCERFETELLDYYFSQLEHALSKKIKLNSQLIVNFSALEKEWRALYPLAWTDFHRFVKGWSPDHWKIHGYSERIANQVVQQLLK